MSVSPSIDALLAGAVAAAEAAGAVLRHKLGSAREIEHKGAIDLVTDADRAAERAAISLLRERFPGHAFLAEEGGASGDSAFRWILDPLDGTTNYAHGIPHFCVSVACEVDGRVEVGAILDPVRGELFTAALGRGARCNGARLAVTQVAEVGEAVLATGFPYTVRERADEVLALFGAYLRRAQGLRRFGSAALDLAWVAAGRYDGYFELELKPWDAAAGALLVREAGGIVTRIDGAPHALAGEILAAGPRLHEALVALGRSARGG